MEILSNFFLVVIFFAIVFSIIVMSFVLAFRRWKKTNHFMNEFAQTHGLNFHAATFPFLFNPSLSGKVRGFSVTLQMVSKGSGKSSTTYTVLEFELPQNTGFPFHVFEAGFFSTMGKVFGLQDIEIGDPVFDAKFIIKSDDELKIRQLLTPSIREWFTRCADQYLNWGIRCDGKFLYYEKQGSMCNLKFYNEFVDMFNLFCELGENFKSLR